MRLPIARNVPLQDSLAWSWQLLLAPVTLPKPLRVPPKPQPPLKPLPPSPPVPPAIFTAFDLPLCSSHPSSEATALPSTRCYSGGGPDCVKLFDTYYLCMYVSMYVYTYVCMYACMYVCMCVLKSLLIACTMCRPRLAVAPLLRFWLIAIFCYSI